MSNPGNTPIPMNYETNQSVLFPPIRGRAKAAIICIVVTLISEVILAGLMFLTGPLLAMTEKPDAKNAMIMMVGGISLIAGSCFFFIAFVVGIVFFCLWIHRATRAARLLEPGFEFTPGWSVGWFFIPLANLIQPFKVVKGLWQVSNPGDDFTSPYRNRAVPGIVPGWWLCYIFGNILQNIASRIQDKIETSFVAAIINVTGTILVIISGILCIKIIRSITHHLENHGMQSGITPIISAT